MKFSTIFLSALLALLVSSKHVFARDETNSTDSGSSEGDEDGLSFYYLPFNVTDCEVSEEDNLTVICYDPQGNSGLITPTPLDLPEAGYQNCTFDELVGVCNDNVNWTAILFNISYCEFHDGLQKCYDPYGNAGHVSPTPEDEDNAPTQYSNCFYNDLEQTACLVNDTQITWEIEYYNVTNCEFINGTQWCFDAAGNPGTVDPTPENDDAPEYYKYCHSDDGETTNCFTGTDYETEIAWNFVYRNLSDCHFEDDKYVCTIDFDNVQGYLQPTPSKDEAESTYKWCHSHQDEPIACFNEAEDELEFILLDSSNSTLSATGSATASGTATSAVNDSASESTSGSSASATESGSGSSASSSSGASSSAASSANIAGHAVAPAGLFLLASVLAFFM